MKYTILINQKAIVDGGFIGKTDLIDWAILDYISGWEINKKSVRQLDYVWVNYSNLLSEMPAIGINSKQVLSRRISKIRTLGLLETIQDPDGRLYAKTSVLFNSLVAVNSESTPVNETNTLSTLESTPCELSTQHPCELSTQQTVNSKVDIQQTTNNKPSLSKQSEDLDQKKEHCAKNAQSKKTKPAKPKKENSCFKKPTAEDVFKYTGDELQTAFDAYKFIDYYESNGWMVGKQKMKDWKSTVRNWIRRDQERNPQKSPDIAPHNNQGLPANQNQNQISGSNYATQYQRKPNIAEQMAEVARIGAEFDKRTDYWLSLGYDQQEADYRAGKPEQYKIGFVCEDSSTIVRAHDVHLRA